MSLMPTYLGLCGASYCIGAIILSLGLVAFGASVSMYRSRPHARRLLMASVVYLPALLILMSADRPLIP